MRGCRVGLSFMLLGVGLVAACSPESRTFQVAETGGTAGTLGSVGGFGAKAGGMSGEPASGAAGAAEQGGAPGSGAAGSSGAPMKDQGDACADDAECQSASCRDGVCCDAVCDGGCEACSKARSGAADGTCTAIAAEADPDDDCEPPSTATCSKDADCDAGEYCAGATCTSKKSSGSACDKDEECSSTFCRDGVCCEGSCDLSCQACSKASTGLANGKCGKRTSSTALACPSTNPTSCVDVETDLANCGSCGNACPSSSIAGAVRSCANGTCGLACPPGSLGDGKNVCIPASTLAAAQKYTCGLLSTGKVSCWGDTSGGFAPSATVSSYKFSSLSAGFYEVCGLRDSGQVVCWGASPSTHTGPYIALSTGAYHTCGIKADQTLDCWSSDGDTVIETEPSGKYKGIASMNHYACALIAGGAQDGKLKCWGDSPNYEFRPPPTDQVFTRIVGGGDHACGIKPDKTIRCFGLLYNGVDYPAMTPFKTLGSGGATHYCGVLDDDTIFCWGSDGGEGGPPASEPSGTFKTVALGSNHTCGVSTAGRVVCAGDNTYGQSVNQPGPFQAW